MPRRSGRAGPSLNFIGQFVVGGGIVVAAIVLGLLGGIHAVSRIPGDVRERHAVACTSDTQDDCVRDESVTIESNRTDGDDNWFLVVDETVDGLTLEADVPVDEDYAREIPYPEPATLAVVDRTAIEVMAQHATFPTEDDPTHLIYGNVRTTFTAFYIVVLALAWLFAYVALADLTRVWRISGATLRRGFRSRATAGDDAGPTLTDVAKQDPAGWRRRRARTDRSGRVAIVLLAGLPAVLGLNVGLGLYADHVNVAESVVVAAIGVAITATIYVIWIRSTRRGRPQAPSPA